MKYPSQNNVLLISLNELEAETYLYIQGLFTVEKRPNTGTRDSLPTNLREHFFFFEYEGLVHKCSSYIIFRYF